MSKPIISVSGLRGIVGESLDPFLVSRYALAFASTLARSKSKKPTILIGRDGRDTGRMYANAISSALMSAGWNVFDADVCATPTVGVLVRDLQCTGGIQISASHNPPEYNGMKLFGEDGRVISAGEGESVIAAYEKNEFDFVGFEQVGSLQQVEDTVAAHLDLVLKTVDREKIRENNFKVVLDSNHGAGSVVAKRLLKELGCDFQILGDTPDGKFSHVPEPTAENLKSVAESAKSFGADVVFCQDPDADRLAIIDESGNYIGEEYTLAITLAHATQSRANKTSDTSENVVVINCATSRMSIDIAENAHVKCVVSAVGEANVTSEMIRQNAIYGGEGNGGPIDPRVGYVRDSFVAMAQTLDAMASENATISVLANQIQPYSIVKSKVELDRALIPQVFDLLVSEFSNAESNRMDGLRLDFESAWLLIRAEYDAEPIVRVIAEAKTEDQAKSLVDRTEVLIKTLI